MADLSWLQTQLDELKAKGLYNEIRVLESPMDARIKINGREKLNFCANNYLGLANHPRLKQAAIAAIEQYGIGPGAVRSIAGTYQLHTQLEEVLAKFKGAEACLSLQSGFTANLAVIPALVGAEDVIFSDELNHASIIDGCRLSRARVVRYAHNNMQDLQEKIRQTGDYQRRLIISDGVFSMDGDIAPLDQLCLVAEEHDILLMVDDAHGEGVLGRGGRGIVDHFGLHGRVDVEVGTLSKAFGVVGGLVAGKRTLIDWLRQRARPFLFSSAMTLPDAAACLEAVALLSESEALVARLWQNVAVMRAGLQSMGFNTGNSQTPIIPLMLGEASLAQAFARRLMELGLFAMPIAYPTVAVGKARIRVMNSAAHSGQDLEEALGIFGQVGRELGVIASTSA